LSRCYPRNCPQEQIPSFWHIRNENRDEDTSCFSVIGSLTQRDREPNSSRSLVMRRRGSAAQLLLGWGRSAASAAALAVQLGTNCAALVTRREGRQLSTWLSAMMANEWARRRYAEMCVPSRVY
jgi:hypothetical protein